MELRDLIPWVGPAGRELDECFLRRCGLTRDHDVYITNVSLCAPSPDRYTNQYLACGKRHLPRDLAIAQPEAVVAMGRLALLQFGITTPLDVCHGIPQLVDRPELNWSGIVWPTYSPAAAMKDEGMAGAAIHDWHAIGAWLRGEIVGGSLPLVQDEYPNPVYWRPKTEDEIKESLYYPRNGGYTHGYIAVDTEDDNAAPGKPPWCLTYSVTLGEACIIKAEDWGLIRYWLKEVRDLNDTWIYHHGLHDVRVLARMGVQAPLGTGISDPYSGGDIDTYQWAYQHDLARSLKTLAYRLCGMHMAEYQDVAGKWGEATLIYLAEVATNEWDEELPSVRSHPISKLARRILSDVAQGKRTGKKEKPVNPVERWKHIDWERRRVVEEVMGEIPLAGLSEIPFEVAMAYACRDADATLRVWLKMEMDSHA